MIQYSNWLTLADGQLKTEVSGGTANESNRHCIYQYVYNYIYQYMYVYILCINQNQNIIQFAMNIPMDMSAYIP